MAGLRTNALTVVIVAVNLALRPLGRAIDRRPESGEETPSVYTFRVRWDIRTPTSATKR